MNFIALPRLTTLYLADTLPLAPTQPPIRTFLENLQLPSLQNLTYQLSGKQISLGPTNFGDTHPLLQFMRSQIHVDAHLPLRRLRIESCSMSQTVLISLLALTPKLKHLWLEHAKIGGPWPKRHLQLPKPLWDDRVLLALSPTSSTNLIDNDPVELLCPRLQSLRVDRSLFTLQQLREFVRGRLAWRGDDVVAQPGPGALCLFPRLLEMKLD